MGRRSAAGRALSGSGCATVARAGAGGASVRAVRASRDVPMIVLLRLLHRVGAGWALLPLSITGQGEGGGGYLTLPQPPPSPCPCRIAPRLPGAWRGRGLSVCPVSMAATGWGTSDWFVEE